MAESIDRPSDQPLDMSLPQTAQRPIPQPVEIPPIRPEQLGPGVFAPLPPRYTQQERQATGEKALRTSERIKTDEAIRQERAKQQAEAEFAIPTPHNLDPRSPEGRAADIATQEEMKRRQLGPYAPKSDTSLTETELALRAVKGDKEAKAALDMLNQLRKSGQIEAGQYLTYTDKRGVITAWINPKTGKIVRPADFGLEGEGFKGAMSMDRQTREAAATSGLKAITKFRQELAKNPNLLVQLATPGSPGARTALAAKREIIDVLTRIRTGAALNTNEEDFYNNQAPVLLDQLFGDPETVEYKLGIFEQQFKDLAPPAPGIPNPTGPERRVKMQDGSVHIYDASGKYLRTEPK